MDLCCATQTATVRRFRAWRLKDYSLGSRLSLEWTGSMIKRPEVHRNKDCNTSEQKGQEEECSRTPTAREQTDAPPKV